MRFGSVCSGIEAASAAWHPLGWSTSYVADIEPFPCAVLAHRIGTTRPRYMPQPSAVPFPANWTERRAALLARVAGDGRIVSANGRAAMAALEERRSRAAAIRALDGIAWGDEVTNYGDFTAIVDEAGLPEIDLLVGGTPCQAFSVAGARQSLADARGNLTLKFVGLVHAHAGKHLRWAVWENVPGVLSTADNAFGCFLGALVGGDAALCVPGGGRWPDAGMVEGPLGRAAWRVLDAQHFGLAQRRRRVLLVFCPAAAAGDPVAVLFERKGVRGDHPAGGEAGEGVAGTIAGGARARGGYSTDDIPLAPTLTATFGEQAGQDLQPGAIVQAFGGGNRGGPVDVAACHEAGGNKQDFEVETFIAEPMQLELPIAHTLRAEGFDASEDGTGRGTPLVPVPFDTTQVTSTVTRSNPRAGDPCHPLAAGAHAPAIAFDCKASGQNGFGVGEVAATLRSMGHSKSHQNGGGHAAVQTASAARRLTPTECERLQGFPDDWTAIPWRGDDEACDGPRYKALGNSMAVPVMHWIGARIAAYEAGTLDRWRPTFLQRVRGWLEGIAA